MTFLKAIYHYIESPEIKSTTTCISGGAGRQGRQQRLKPDEDPGHCPGRTGRLLKSQKAAITTVIVV
jgi:hypothetical protein